MTEKLRIDHVGMKYQSLNGEINALEDVNFVVHDGDFISIVGPSGCGKSTLLSIISGLLPLLPEVFISMEKKLPVPPGKSVICSKKTIFLNGVILCKMCF